MRKALALCLCGVLLSVQAGFAADQRALNSLKKLDPSQRLEQRCDLEAMERIAADRTGYRPDKVIAYTFTEPDVEGDSISAAGAAFRSKGQWYRLRYDCRTGPERLDIQAFDYRIGKAVPREEWQEYYLVE